MKRLILMRHAKSSWAEDGLRDHDRPLNERGREEAPLIGGWLAERGHAPQAALVSTALRTQETWALLGPGFADVPMTARRDLYDANLAALRAAVRAAPEVERLMLLGHQPGMGGFARQMLDDLPEDPLFMKYPTSAAAVIDLDIPNWSAFEIRGGALVAFVTPAGARAEPDRR